MSNSNSGEQNTELIPNATQPNVTPPTPTAAQEQAAVSHYGVHHYSDGQNVFTKLIHAFSSDPNATDVLDPSTVQKLQNGLATRSAPAAPAHNYAAMSHQQLYDAVTQNVDARQIGTTASSWDRYSQDLIDASQSSASQALASSELTWTGKNGDSARAAVASLANTVGQAGQAAQVSAQLYQQQADALSTAKHSIPVPPAHPFNAAAAQQQLMTVTDPAQAANLASQDHAQFAAQQAAHQQAVNVVSNYDNVVIQTSQNQPGFAPAPQVAKPGGGPSGGSPNTPGGARGAGGGSAAPHLANANVSGGGSGASPHGGGSSGGSSAPPPSLGAPGSSNGAPAGSSSLTGLSNAGAPSSGGQTGSPGGFGQSPVGPGTGTPGGGANDVGIVPPMGGMPVGAGGTGADIVRSGGGGGGSGGLGSGGGYGSGGAKGFGSGGVGSAGGGAGGAGARSGIGAGAQAAERSAIAGGAAGGRGSGAAGGAMPGGRGGKGGEDGEHKRASFLLEPDADAIFGTDERTVPPVIGE